MQLTPRQQQQQTPRQQQLLLAAWGTVMLPMTAQGMGMLLLLLLLVKDWCFTPVPAAQMSPAAKGALVQVHRRWQLRQVSLQLVLTLLRSCSQRQQALLVASTAAHSVWRREWNRRGLTVRMAECNDHLHVSWVAGMLLWSLQQSITHRLACLDCCAWTVLSLRPGARAKV
jgi:lysylphosphatidylglycerol synthetase-like protein (DUF2156 family)